MLDEKLLTGDITTIERQQGHAEVLLGALISGLTNVAAFTVDELGHVYTGIDGIEDQKVNMHDVGHNKPFGGVAQALKTVAMRLGFVVVWNILSTKSLWASRAAVEARTLELLREDEPGTTPQVRRSMHQDCLLNPRNFVSYPFFTHFPPFFAHFLRLDARNPENTARSPGENGNKSRKFGENGGN